MFNSIRNYGEAFSTTAGYSSVWIFFLPRDRFLPIIILDIIISRKKWLELTGFVKDGCLSNFVRFCSDVESHRRCQQLTMLLGVRVHLELSELLWWRCNHLSQIESGNSLRAISLREVTCEWQAKQNMKGRCGKREWELPISSAAHGLAAHSLVRLLLEMAMGRLLSVHNN